MGPWLLKRYEVNIRGFKMITEGDLVADRDVGLGFAFRVCNNQTTRKKNPKP